MTVSGDEGEVTAVVTVETVGLTGSVVAVSSPAGLDVSPLPGVVVVSVSAGSSGLVVVPAGSFGLVVVSVSDGFSGLLLVPAGSSGLVVVSLDSELVDSAVKGQ